MNYVSKTVAAALWLAMASLSAINGQQPEAPKRRSPSLEADGSVRSRSVPGREPSGVMNLGASGEGWSRYLLEDTGASLELPGEPHMVTVAQSEDMAAGVYKTYFYKGGDATVFVTYALTPDSMAAWNFVGGFMKGMTKNLTDSRIEGNRDARAKRVPIRVTGKINGAAIEFKGTIFFIDEQKEVLMVLAQFPQSSANARAFATRAMDSVEVPR
jgi:hypothetical protein